MVHRGGKRPLKKNLKKISKNYCGIKKRVVSLHPLNRQGLGSKVPLKCLTVIKLRFEKKTKKNTKTICWIKKRVLYLHPLSKETS